MIFVVAGDVTVVVAAGDVIIVPCHAYILSSLKTQLISKISCPAFVMIAFCRKIEFVKI